MFHFGYTILNYWPQLVAPNEQAKAPAPQWQDGSVRGGLTSFVVGIALVTLAAGQTGLSREAAYRRARELASLGRKLFFDAGLSESGKLSCASCHDPHFAYGPPNAQAVQAGGHRAVPSLKYLQVVPPFTEHYFDAELTGDDSVDAGPTGGLTWDGRVDRGRDQARIPLLSPFEMANESPADVVARALRASYSAELVRLAGRTDAVFATILEALETWQQDYREFYPYSSKYDAWLAGKAQLTDAEARGLAAFEDPQKGNCASCHPSERGVSGTPPQFTDYALVALGVPRSREIAANDDAKWFDLGLCGPDRTDLKAKSEYCGRFRTPTLRNVALRQVFFHNGVVHSLKDAVTFYAQRDSEPERWYPRDAAGAVKKFDDLPEEFRKNVEAGAPFGKSGQAKAPTPQGALTDGEVADIVAFLKTLTDGYRLQSH